MNRLLRSLLIVAAATLSTIAAYADDSVFHGQWQQVSSNAGSCNTCLITIIRHGALMTVTANNGWSAIIGTNLNTSSRFAEGTGRWQENVRSVYGNSPFDIAFALNDERLYMRMVVKIGNGTTHSIKAIFSRPLPRSKQEACRHCSGRAFQASRNPADLFSSSTDTPS
ncbi:hypothetical protein [Rhizobium giardinii]|uniref:DUF2147 domain-containing protein n=1 Tax=Rhizobium giardinii TaxID=56731 RepID=A0A7W8X8U1_9HYPH|nr:hypothetical protein [Rhizobium giardinii]MBB5534843.1 hypothetical protein [Rhizobium giardinii]